MDAVAVLSLNVKRGRSLGGVLTRLLSRPRERIRLLPPDRIAIPVGRDRGGTDNFMLDVALRDRHRADGAELACALASVHFAIDREQCSRRKAGTDRPSQVLIRAPRDFKRGVEETATAGNE